MSSPVNLFAGAVRGRQAESVGRGARPFQRDRQLEVDGGVRSSFFFVPFVATPLSSAQMCIDTLRARVGFHTAPVKEIPFSGRVELAGDVFVAAGVDLPSALARNRLEQSSPAVNN